MGELESKNLEKEKHLANFGGNIRKRLKILSKSFGGSIFHGNSEVPGSLSAHLSRGGRHFGHGRHGRHGRL